MPTHASLLSPQFQQLLRDLPFPPELINLVVGCLFPLLQSKIQEYRKPLDTDIRSSLPILINNDKKLYCLLLKEISTTLCMDRVIHDIIHNFRTGDCLNLICTAGQVRLMIEWPTDSFAGGKLRDVSTETSEKKRHDPNIWSVIDKLPDTILINMFPRLKWLQWDSNQCL